MILKERIRKMMISAGLDEADYQRIRLEMWAANQRSVTTFSAVAAALLLAMSVLSFVVPSLAEMRRLYIFSALACACIYVLARGPARRSPALTCLAMYAFILLLQLFSIVLGTMYATHELAVSYIALLVAAPQVFTDRPRRMCGEIVVSCAIFIGMCILMKEPEVWTIDVVDAVAFGVLSLFSCSYLMKLKLERYVFEDDTRILAETDQLTGTRNRNSYELQLRRLPELPMETIAAVYVDVNGLHEINNTQGHTAGDAMLCCVARIMQGLFGGDNTYRIGGDEFVALVQDRPQSEMQARVKRLESEAAAAGYHVAVGMGFCRRRALDVNDLIREAEQEMYRNKDIYYREMGIDRRRH